MGKETLLKHDPLSGRAQQGKQDLFSFQQNGLVPFVITQQSKAHDAGPEQAPGGGGGPAPGRLQDQLFPHARFQNPGRIHLYLYALSVCFSCTLPLATDHVSYHSRLLWTGRTVEEVETLA